MNIPDFPEEVELITIEDFYNSSKEKVRFYIPKRYSKERIIREFLILTRLNKNKKPSEIVDLLLKVAHI
jgi:hypothetical protein